MTKTNLPTGKEENFKTREDDEEDYSALGGIPPLF
jgi:hypothetical protein